MTRNHEDIDHIRNVRDRLDTVGPGFCLLKWTQQTLYLHLGDNHSCYHPWPHQITKEDIARSPSGLHNTAHKKAVRKEMLEGKRPKECNYCWAVEDLPGDHLSDRMIHSAHMTPTEVVPEPFGGDLYGEISRLPWDADYNPRLIEVSFGNMCNFKCGYCCPQASSSILEEIKEHGEFGTSTAQYSIDFLKQRQFYNADDPNPYVDAFWKWWPDLKRDLRTLRITGGEPLLNPNTFRLLDVLEADPAPHMEVLCNSNLGVKPALIEKLSRRVNAMLEAGTIKRFRMHTSIDTWGPEAEYIRYGLKCSQWEENFRAVLTNFRHHGSAVEIMVTFNALVLTSFKRLLTKILEWRRDFSAPLGRQRVDFCTPHLKEPPHFMLQVLPDEFKEHLRDCIRFMEQNRSTGPNDVVGFSRLEIARLQRVLDWWDATPLPSEKLAVARRDFRRFFTEHDRRRRTNFRSTFPLYAPLLDAWRDE